MAGQRSSRTRSTTGNDRARNRASDPYWRWYADGRAFPALLAARAARRRAARARLRAGARKVARRAPYRLARYENRLGLIDEFCAHRGASLWFGRNEEGGLRCAYHGWKYDITGQCVEIPSEPDDPRLCQRMKLKSYPLIERGGVLWAYLGPAENQ